MMYRYKKLNEHTVTSPSGKHILAIFMPCFNYLYTTSKMQGIKPSSKRRENWLLMYVALCFKVLQWQLWSCSFEKYSHLYDWERSWICKNQMIMCNPFLYMSLECFTETIYVGNGPTLQRQPFTKRRVKCLTPKEEIYWPSQCWCASSINSNSDQTNFDDI